VGNPLLPSNDIARSLIPWRKKQYLLALGADQSPASGDNGYWLYFMNRPAIFPKGPEKFARSQNIPVVMMNTSRPQRGIIILISFCCRLILNRFRKES
jgi:lauroyl/myristoyl acyltransferase